MNSPLYPALRSGQRLFQQLPAKSKFLLVTEQTTYAMPHAANPAPRSSSGFYHVFPYLAMAACSPLLAQTPAFWDGSTGDWEDGTRWSTDPDFPNNDLPTPGITYDATINEGEATLNSTVTLNRLLLSGGTLLLNQDDNPITLNAGFDWSGGKLQRTASQGISIGAAGSSLWSGSLEMIQTPVQNAGQLTLADGMMMQATADFGENAGLKNLSGGTVTLQGSGSWLGNWFGEGAEPDGFNNQGSLVKNGAGTFVFGALSEFSAVMPFQNSGSVAVNGGVLQIDGSFLSSSGSWTVADGARLAFQSLNASAGSSFSGAGDVDFSGNVSIVGSYGVTGLTTVKGGLQFNSANPVSVPNMLIAPGGGIGGSAAVSVTRSLEWSGDIAGDATSQTFTLDSGATGSITFDSRVFLSQRTFNNQGAFIWLGGTTAGSSVLGFLQNAVFNNLAGATFTAAGNGTGGTVGFGGSTSGAFFNTGIFQKIGSGTSTRLNWAFSNSGTVDAQSGRLEIANLTASGGMYQVADGAQLFLARQSGTGETFNGTYSVAAGGQLELNLSVGFNSGNLGASALFPLATGTVVLKGNGEVSRDTLSAGLVRFASATRISPPSGTMAIANAELVSGGSIGLLLPNRLRVTDSLNWTGGGISTPAGFIGFTGGTLELAAASVTTLSGLGTVADATLQVDGTLNVTPGGTLSIGANGIVRNNSALAFGAGTMLELNPSTSAAKDATVIGGTLTTSGTGVIRVGSGRNVSGAGSYATLDGASVNGTVELNQNLSRLRLINGANVQGTVKYASTALSGAGNFTSFEVHTDASLDHVRLEDNTTVQGAKSTFVVIGSRTVTFGTDAEFSNVRSILGDFFDSTTGQIISTGDSSIINKGRIVADGAGKISSLAALDTFENRGSLEALNGAAMTVDRSFTQTAGRILVTGDGSFTMTNPSYRPSTSTVTITGGSLEGQGSFNGSLILDGGMIAPGSSPGLLTINGGVSVLSGLLSFELGGLTRGTLHDAIDANGQFDLGLLGAELRLAFLNGFQNSAQGTDSFNLITATTLAGTFSNVANGGRLVSADGHGSFQVNYGTGSTFGENSVVLSDFIAVPEPSSFAMLGLGILLILGPAARNRRA